MYNQLQSEQRATESPREFREPREPQRPADKGATSNALRKIRVCIVIEICCNRTGYEKVTKICIANIHWKYVQSVAQPCLAKRLSPCVFFLSTQLASQKPVQLHHAFIYFLDWNDFGIDDRPFSSIVYGGPEDWFGSHGWHVEGVEDGEDWSQIVGAYHRLLVDNHETSVPKVIYSKTRKGRGYYIYDSKSHGAAHKRNSNLFWKTKKDFINKYEVTFEDFGGVANDSWEGQLDQARSMFETVFTVMSSNQEYVDYLSSRLIELGDSVPNKIKSCLVDPKTETNRKSIFGLSITIRVYNINISNINCHTTAKK